MTSPALVRAGSISRSLLRLSLFGGLLLSLAACAATTGIVHRFAGGGGAVASTSAAPPARGATLAEAEAALTRGDALGAANIYRQAAPTAAPALAADYRMRAAEAANAGRDPARADLILDQIPAAPLDAHQQARYRLLRAQTALARNDPTRALRLLPAGNPGGEAALAEQQLLTRGRALSRTGDAVGATQALVLREHYLSGNSAIAENRELIWSGLGGTTLDAAALGRAAAASAVTRGWVELAALARRSASLQDYDLWRKRYPGHPGEERLASLYLPTQAEVASPQPQANLPPLGTPTTNIPITTGAGFNAIATRGGRAALLLPQSGPIFALGESVRAGFAALSTLSGDGTARIYDTATGGVDALYQQAVADGAGYIIGPIRKEDAMLLAQSGRLPTPVLALNYLDAGRAPPPGFYQFGLAPEDEARAAAEDAFGRGLNRALAMTPNTDWGNRVLLAFEQRLTELGGRVVESGRYGGEPQNWSDPIRRLLRYAPIDDKKKAAEARARVGPGVDPQRRNDFDFVFIAGRASQARVLNPLFRYYHADRLPIYATSAVFEGDGDSDLSGIRFCDAPWVLDNGGAWATLHEEALRSRSFDSARLYALGNDAALLASRIAQNALQPGDSLPGATGLLKVDASGAVHRGLLCAQMTRGLPFVLSAPGLSP